MDEIVKSVRKKYKQRMLNQQKQWPPVSTEKLVKLQLVQAKKKEGFRARSNTRDYNDKKRKNQILYTDLFKLGAKPVHKIIVEGTAGIGKTTLCTMLAEGWAQNKLLHEFDCVLLIPLRETSVAAAPNFTELMKCLHSSERVRTAAVEELQDTEGERVLIIADGWDELDNKHRKPGSFLYDLLFGEILPFASVLLTSRPSASAPLHDLQCVDRLVEIVGFNEDDIESYIRSEFSTDLPKASSLIEQLKINHVVSSVCSIPLNCAIVCHLWNELNGLPRSLTELYKDIVLNVILRDIMKKAPNSAPKLLDTFDSIPTQFQHSFWLICRFAYECLSKDQIVFSEEDLASFFPEILNSTQKVLHFGLLHTSHSLLPTGHALSFHFAHLTIHEFLAALHIITLSNDEKLKIVEAQAMQDRFAMVWKFLFGLGFKKHTSNVPYTRRVVYLNDLILDAFLCLLKSTENELYHCALEIDDESFSRRVASIVGNHFSPENSYDYIAVLHVIRHIPFHSNTQLCLALEDCHIGDRHLPKLTEILRSSSEEIHIIELGLSGNELSDASLNDLFARALPPLLHIHQLWLDDNALSTLSFCANSTAPFKNLSWLSCSNNPLELSALQSIERAVRGRVLFSLEDLFLSNTLKSHGREKYQFSAASALGVQSAKSISVTDFDLSAFLSSLIDYCPKLRRLDLSGNKFAESDIHALGNALPSLAGGKDNFKLYLSDCNFNSQSIQTFSESLNKSMSSMNRLCIRCCRLDLSGNPLEFEGMMGVLRMIGNKHCPITILNLSEVCTSSDQNSLTNDNHELCTLYSAGLTELFIDNNNFHENNLFILEQFLHVCQSLTTLSCWQCSLTSSDMNTLLSDLKSNGRVMEKLTSWNLSQNLIDILGLTALECSMPDTFPSLTHLDINLKYRPSMSYELCEKQPTTYEDNDCKSDQPIPSISNQIAPTEVPTSTLSADTSTVKTTCHPNVPSLKTASEEITLTILNRELKSFTKPTQLAVALGIPQDKIEIFKRDNPLDTEGQKIALFGFIAKNYITLGLTWTSISDALNQIGYGDLSLAVRKKYTAYK